MGAVHRTAKWQRVQRTAYRRDLASNAPCHICGQPIDYAAPRWTPDSYEADHIKPADKYPELAFQLSNIAASHCSCNRSKGDREQGHERPLGRPSREW